jgi:hypothetical protein
VTEHLFDLSGSEYWDAPWKNAGMLRKTYAQEMRFGIYVDAPDAIDPTLRASAPMPLFLVTNGNRETKAPLRGMGKVLAVKLEDRKVLVNAALAPKDKQKARPLVPSNDPISFEETVDLQERVKLLDEAGTYVVRVINVAQLSNTLTIKVERKKPTSDDPAVVEFLESQRTKKVFPPPPAPSASLRRAPDGKPLPGAAPADLGVILSATRVVLLKEGAEGVLKGGFRLKVLPQERVPAPEVLKEGERPTQPDYGTPRPTAILPITLLVIGDKTGELAFVPLAVPTWDTLSDSDPVASGTFELDLLPHLAKSPQTHHIYAVCGEAFVGPTLLATVTQDMLPKPGE